MRKAAPVAALPKAEQVVPTRLEPFVKWTGGNLNLYRDRGGLDVGVAVGLSMAGATLAMLLFLVLTIVLGSFGAVLGLLMAVIWTVIPGLLYLAWPRKRTIKPGAGGWVQVFGAPSRAVSVQYNSTVLLQTEDTINVWTYANITWFAKRVAEIKQAQLQDNRDAEAWNGWESGPNRRAHITIQTDYLENFEQYPVLHQQAGVEPESVVYDHHGMNCVIWHSKVKVTSEKVFVDSRVFPLHRFERITADFTRDNENRFRYRVRAVAFNRLYTLLTIRGFDGGPYHHINWFVQYLTERSQAATKPELGNANEVPDALDALVKGSGREG